MPCNTCRASARAREHATRKARPRGRALASPVRGAGRARAGRGSRAGCRRGRAGGARARARRGPAGAGAATAAAARESRPPRREPRRHAPDSVATSTHGTWRLGVRAGSGRGSGSGWVRQGLAMGCTQPVPAPTRAWAGQDPPTPTRTLTGGLRDEGPASAAAAPRRRAPGPTRRKAGGEGSQRRAEVQASASGAPG